jgi:hypothetical protein
LVIEKGGIDDLIVDMVGIRLFGSKRGDDMDGSLRRGFGSRWSR